MREKLVSELKEFTKSEDLTVWAQRILVLKNQLTTSDAQEVETAFLLKLNELGDDTVVKPEMVAKAEVGGDCELPPANGEPIPTTQRPKAERKPNSRRIPAGGEAAKNVFVNGITSEAAAQSVTPLSKPLRLRDRDHLKFVSAQPCLACGRTPSDAHHLRFAQQRALGRKVSDEFTVPLCRAHHRELHQRGDELTWWQHHNLDPLQTAQSLWKATHPSSESPTSISALPHP